MGGRIRIDPPRACRKAVSFRKGESDGFGGFGLRIIGDVHGNRGGRLHHPPFRRSRGNGDVRRRGKDDIAGCTGRGHAYGNAFLGSRAPEMQEQMRRSGTLCNARGRIRKADGEIVVARNGHLHNAVKVHVPRILSRGACGKLDEFVGFAVLIVDNINDKGQGRGVLRQSHLEAPPGVFRLRGGGRPSLPFPRFRC